MRRAVGIALLPPPRQDPGYPHQEATNYTVAQVFPMIRFSERQALLLQLLSEVHSATAGSDLAALLGVSSRTLRYDIARINGMTRSEIIEASAHGYTLNRRAYGDLLGRTSGLATHLDHQERILLFLLSRPHTDIYEIMVECFMSESVTRTALQRLKPQVEKHGLHIEVHGADVALVGSELNIRHLLGEFVHNAMDVVVGQDERLNRYLPDVDLGVIRRNLVSVIADHGLHADDIHLSNTVVNLAICLQRSHFRVDVDPSIVPSLDEGMTQLAEQVLSSLEDTYPDLAVYPVDRAYVHSVIGLALDPHTDRPNDSHEVEPDRVFKVVQDCLDDAISHFGLSADRSKLDSDIAAHVERLSARDRSMLFFRNNLQESLRARSPLLYDVAVYLADLLNKTLGISFPDDEIGLLAVYLGLHTLPSKSPMDTTHTIVVCPDYHALRDWVLTGLFNRYQDRLSILDVVTTLDGVDLGPCELVISTTDEDSMSCPCVQVSALLSDLDFIALDQALLKSSQSKIRLRLSQSLRKFLDPDLFFVDAQVSDSDSAISLMCNRLQDHNVVPAEFSDSVRLRETYSPTCFARRFAVPHAMDFLAHETKVCVLFPSSPVRWGPSDVALILMLAINADDYDEFLNFYQPLISLLYDPTLYNELRKVSDFDQFVNFLKDELMESN